MVRVEIGVRAQHEDAIEFLVFLDNLIDMGSR